MTKENLDRMKEIMAKDPPLSPADCALLIRHAEECAGLKEANEALSKQLEKMAATPANVLWSDDQITSSRRETIATHLMAGIIAYKGLGSQSWQGVAIDAVRGADALLLRLKE